MTAGTPWPHLERSRALHEEVQRLIRRTRDGSAPSAREFDDLACAIARHQAEAIPALARLWARRGARPHDATRADDLPAVPTAAWKRLRIAAHPAALDEARFLTSGTTVGDRGEHCLRTTATYDLAAWTHGARHLRLGEDDVVLVLVPRALDSSLSHMCALFAGDKAVHALTGSALDLDAIMGAVARARGTVLVLATSFSLVYLLDALGGRTVELPPGSRVMQTGGFKGRSRELEPRTLRAALTRTFGVTEREIVVEYGMTELSSQAYDATLLGGAPEVLVAPPWTRVTACDPATLAPLPPGAIGVLRVVDLANVDSAVAVQTEDLGRVVPGGFELHGRMPGAGPRGCSLAVEELLGAR